MLRDSCLFFLINSTKVYLLSYANLYLLFLGVQGEKRYVDIFFSSSPNTFNIELVIFVFVRLPGNSYTANPPPMRGEFTTRIFPILEGVYLYCF